MYRTSKSWRHFLLPLILFLFGFSQAGATEHAMRYGPGQHQHNGKVCVLSVAVHKDNAVAILPSVPDTCRTPLRFEINFSYVVGTPSFPHQNTGITSSARSPPA